MAGWLEEVGDGRLAALEGTHGRRAIGGGKGVWWFPFSPVWYLDTDKTVTRDWRSCRVSACRETPNQMTKIHSRPSRRVCRHHPPPARFQGVSTGMDGNCNPSARLFPGKKRILTTPLLKIMWEENPEFEVPAPR